MIFLDTNIILRYLTRDEEEKAKACYALFQKIKQGKEKVKTMDTIVAEVVYVLSSRSQYGLSHEDIRLRLLPILTLKGLKMLRKKICLRALELYANDPDLDFEDGLSIASMEKENISQIYSYDGDFDRFPPIKRIEP